MHNCAIDAHDAASAYAKHKQDVERWLKRWSIHPSYAAFLVNAYQDLLDKAELINLRASQHQDYQTTPKTGRSLIESADLMNGLLQHLKGEARKYMDRHASNKP
jgi:hypothetical protein